MMFTSFWILEGRFFFVRQAADRKFEFDRNERKIVCTTINK